MDLDKIIEIAKAYNSIKNAQKFIPEGVIKGGEKLAQKIVRKSIEEYRTAISGEGETYLKLKLINDQALDKLEKQCQNLD